MSNGKPNAITPAADNAPALVGLTSDELMARKKTELVELCTKLGLAIEGTKAKLTKRILAKQAGGDRGVVHGKTICRYCGELATVTGTSSEPLSDGRRMVYRRFKCSGRHSHRFTIEQAEGTPSGSGPENG